MSKMMILDENFAYLSQNVLAAGFLHRDNVGIDIIALRSQEYNSRMIVWMNISVPIQWSILHFFGFVHRVFMLERADFY